jgi:hypothetical protein
VENKPELIDRYRGGKTGRKQPVQIKKRRIMVKSGGIKIIARSSKGKTDL